MPPTSRPPVDPYALALRWLARRELSRAQLRARLLRRSAEAQAVDAALDRLAREGALDDRRVARAFVHTAAVVKGRGRGRILRELATMGIADEVARAAVDEVCGAEEEAARLARALARRARGVDLGDPAVRRRVAAALVRQGFTGEAIAKAFRGAGLRDPADESSD